MDGISTPGVLTGFLRRGKPLESSPLPLYIPFFAERYPFRMSSIEKLTLSHPFNSRKWRAFEHEYR